MHFDLQSLFHKNYSNEIFNELEAPFTVKEVKQVVDNLPNGKSPGPDGFDNEFFKRCWHIIQKDVMQLLHDFYEGSVSLESINSSYITLISKIKNPFKPNDLGPYHFSI